MFEKKPNRLSAGKFFSRLCAVVAVPVIAAVLNGCLSGKIINSRKQFYSDNYIVSADLLSEIKDKEGKNRILALLEYGTALHVAGNYQESTKALLEANRLIEENDVFRIGEKAGTTVTNEMLKTFRPEGFERVLVHTYLAMNFIMVNDWSAARVEAKKALKTLGSLDVELQGQPFTRYICALAFEVMGDPEDAYIEYSKVAGEAPLSLQIHYELYRLAIIRGMGDEAQQWAREIEMRGGVIPVEPKPPNLIVFVSAGRAPIKKEINMVVPPANRFVVPTYESSGSMAHHAVLKIDNEPKASSFMLTDLDPLAKKTLKKRIAKEIASEVVRVAAKEAITRQIEEQSALIGLLVRIFFFLSEAADTRSWETLPRYMGVITQHLEPGTYNVSVEFYTMDGRPMGAVQHNDMVIRKNWRTVLSARSVH